MFIIKCFVVLKMQNIEVDLVGVIGWGEKERTGKMNKKEDE